MEGCSRGYVRRLYHSGCGHSIRADSLLRSGSPLLAGLVRELLRTLQWCCNVVLTNLGAYISNKRPYQGLFEIKVVELLNRVLELLVVLWWLAYLLSY